MRRPAEDPSSTASSLMRDTLAASCDLVLPSALLVDALIRRRTANPFCALVVSPSPSHRHCSSMLIWRRIPPEPLPESRVALCIWLLTVFSSDSLPFSSFLHCFSASAPSNEPTPSATQRSLGTARDYPPGAAGRKKLQFGLSIWCWWRLRCAHMARSAVVLLAAFRSPSISRSNNRILFA
ncbi:hypothetical protein B0H16DRAFT_537929 [Mycena metata]|uniref:Uncharacterized protein n=1 Tax=Mycena metata TaxID=1033252 RepID=A0AAD7NGT3_9AGAR|nr:hypothetical protein B0H16DRAFT_537929 [Mycena metata]